MHSGNFSANVSNNGRGSRCAGVVTFARAWRMKMNSFFLKNGIPRGIWRDTWSQDVLGYFGGVMNLLREPYEMMLHTVFPPGRNEGNLMGKLVFMKCLPCRGAMIYDQFHGSHFSLGAGFWQTLILRLAVLMEERGWLPPMTIVLIIAKNEAGSKG